MDGSHPDALQSTSSIDLVEQQRAAARRGRAVRPSVSACARAQPSSPKSLFALRIPQRGLLYACKSMRLSRWLTARSRRCFRVWQRSRRLRVPSRRAAHAPCIYFAQFCRSVERESASGVGLCVRHGMGLPQRGTVMCRGSRSMLSWDAQSLHMSSHYHCACVVRMGLAPDASTYFICDP